MDNETVPDVIADWEIEVSDNFRGAQLTFRALGKPGHPEAGGTYACRPMFLELERLRRLQKELDGLIRYMEKGVAAPGASLQ
ncbi:hypothetical protein ARC78_15150 [Stenotrophomonas pictorum JCM 9942]|uniref:Uncharacterized protein n=1 Tax=Stenotrophomonas pictorum JCM 9942 TaxID=1236960 RepID=A0A0R0A9U9_9GAMM|nr:hypothetical protein [Stenotrophomonas pictorum]KRG38874.1 hypothetical protein ARC78_15150 [Stenotrophomonas pictorum JCM 9942]